METRNPVERAMTAVILLAFVLGSTPVAAAPVLSIAKEPAPSVNAPTFLDDGTDTGNDISAEDDPHSMVMSSTTLLSEDWESGTINPAKWTIFGDPQPDVYPGVGLEGSYAVNNNGDGLYASGLFVPTVFDVTQGIDVEFWLRGGGPIGERLSGNDAGFTVCDPSVNHETCSDWIAFIHTSAEDNTVVYQAETGDGWESRQEVWEPLAGEWHKYRFTIAQDGLIFFYRDDELKFATTASIDFGVYSQAWLEIRGRSMYGAYYYVDDILVTDGGAPGSGMLSGRVMAYTYTGYWPCYDTTVRLNSDQYTQTDASGDYLMEVPAGTYDVTFVKPEYKTITSTNQLVSENQTTTLDVSMIKEECWPAWQVCVNEFINVIPILGIGSEVSGFLDSVCRFTERYDDDPLGALTILIPSLVDLISDVIVPLKADMYDLAEAFLVCIEDLIYNALDSICGPYSLQCKRTFSRSIWRNIPGGGGLIVFVDAISAGSASLASQNSTGVPPELHLYSGSQHLGPKNGYIEHTIPTSYLFRAGDSYQIAIIKGATAQYELRIEGQDTTDYSMVIINPRSDGTGTLVSYETLVTGSGSVASLALGQDITDFTLEVDLDGDGNVDELISPDLTERVWPATLYLPLVLRNYTPGTEPITYPPYTPSNPLPYDGAANQSVDVDLSWTGGDPDGDDVTYDVYFGPGTARLLICDDVTSTSCNPSTLSPNTYYSWQVVAQDEHGATTPGPVWDFTTLQSCHVRLNDNPTEYDTVQAAVDAANDGDTVKVAGYCAGVEARAGVTQTVYISKNITLRGGYTTTNWTTPDPVANPTTLDAQGQGRALYIAGSISPMVEGLRITGGDASGVSGYGGGVYIANAAAVISNNWVFSNTASGGGGLYLYFSDAILSRNVISDNNATQHAGGLYLNYSDATLSDNVVSSNSALSRGGGLRLRYSAAVLNGNTVFSNTASEGAGLYLYESPASLSNNTINSNTVSDDGGGIFLNYSNATLSANTITSNTATDRGGGIYLISATATISNNQVSSNTADYGGGLYLYYSAATLSENLVTSNTAHTRAGGLYLDYSDAMLSDNTITSNAASGSGGGLRLYYSAPTLSGNTISSNTASHGGGLYLYRSPATLNGNTVSSNAVSDHGGGLYLSESDATLSSNTISSNTARRGGGLRLWSSAAALSGNTVISNTADDGGGLHLYDSAATLTNTLVVDNQANGTGSGLYIEGSSPTLLHTTIARNSGGDGSGVFVTGFTTMIQYVESNVVLSNTILVSHTVGISVTRGGSVEDPFSFNKATLNATLWGFGAWANTTDWGGTGTVITGTVNVWGDPAFVNPDAGNYHIGAGSAARDTGVDAGVTTDIDGQTRPQGAGYDLGADEYWP